MFGVRQRIPDAALHLLSRLLQVDPAGRLSVGEVMRHPWVACSADAEAMELAAAARQAAAALGGAAAAPAPVPAAVGMPPAAPVGVEAPPPPFEQLQRQQQIDKII